MAITNYIDGNSTAYRQNTNFNNKPSYGQPVGNNNFTVPSYPKLVPDQLKAGYQAPQEQPEAPAFHPDNIQNASSFVNGAIQNKATGQAPVAQATTAQAGEKVNTDLNAIASGQATPEQVQSDPFYKDNAFYSGVMQTGLAIMSGANPLQAFQAGQQGTQQAQAQQKQENVSNMLKQQAPDLLKDYSMASVQAAIASGDPSMLKEKHVSDEQRRAWEQEDQKAQFAQQEKMENMRLDAQRSQDQLREKLANAKSDAAATAAEAKQQTQDIRTIKGNTNTMRTNYQKRVSGFNTAEKLLEKMNDPNASNIDKQAAWQQAQEQVYNAINVGSNAERTQEKIQHLVGQPGLFNVVGNKIQYTGSGLPTGDAVKYLTSALHQDKDAYMSSTGNDLYGMADNWISNSDDPEEVKKQLETFNRGHGLPIKLTPKGYASWKAAQSGEEAAPTAPTAPQPAQAANAPKGSLSQPAFDPWALAGINR